MAVWHNVVLHNLGLSNCAYGNLSNGSNRRITYPCHISVYLNTTSIYTIKAWSLNTFSKISSISALTILDSVFKNVDQLLTKNWCCTAIPTNKTKIEIKRFATIKSSLILKVHISNKRSSMVSKYTLIN